MIVTEDFVHEMQKHWTERLGNVSSTGLERAWSMLGDSLLELSRNSAETTKGKKFKALQFPTGSGKTQGIVVYFSMLSKLPEETRPAGFIITRRIADADAIARSINELSRQCNPEQQKDVAVSYHSKAQDRTPEMLSEYLVLVITHSAYQHALMKLGNMEVVPERWNQFYQYGASKTRELVVIDEAIDLVEHFQVNPQYLQELPRFFTQAIREKFADEVMCVECFMEVFNQIDEKAAVAKSQEELHLSHPLLESLKDKFSDKGIPDFTEFRNAMKKVDYDKHCPFGKEDSEERLRIAKIVDSLLSSVNVLLRSWMYYARDNALHTLNTAKPLIPDDARIQGALILDATASPNVIYKIFKQVEVVVSPPDIRSYRNVTLHVSRNHKTGKVSMRKESSKKAEEFANALKAELGEKGKRVLVVTHKHMETHLKAYSADALGLERYEVNHFGNIDGSNEWQDFDTIVLFGLPYRPNWWSTNTYFAFQGPQSTDWLRSSGDRPFGPYADIREALETGQLVSDAVQAINRIRCRRTIDADGNCPVSDIYLILPNGKTGDAILQGIKQEMPQIQEKSWTLNTAQRKIRKTKHEEVLCSFFLYVMEEGERLKGTTLCKRLQIPQRTFTRIRKRLREQDTKDTLIATLKQAGIAVEWQGLGRSCCFRKLSSASVTAM